MPIQRSNSGSANHCLRSTRCRCERRQLVPKQLSTFIFTPEQRGVAAWLRATQAAYDPDRMIAISGAMA